MYTLIVTTFYNYTPENVLKDGLDPVENIIIEIQAAVMAIHDICEAANNAISGGFFMASLASEPTMAKNLTFSKLYF